MHKPFDKLRFFALLAQNEQSGERLDNLERELLELFYFSRRLGNLRDATLKCYADRLQFLLDLSQQLDTPFYGLNRYQIEAYIASLVGRVSAETINGRIRVFRVFFNYLTTEGFINKSPMDSIRFVQGERRIKDCLTPDQVELIINSITDDSFFGARDRLIFRVLYDCWLRVSDIANMRLSGVNLESRTIKLESGKTREERFVPISSDTAHELKKYLVRWRQSISGPFVFPYSDGDALTDERIYKMVVRHSRRVGLKCYPHLLRHSGASQYLIAGGSAEFAQKILGHSSIYTTRIYLHLDKEHLVSVHDQFSPVMRMNGHRRRNRRMPPDRFVS